MKKLNKDYEEYTHWKGLRARCNAPCLSHHKSYQAKGISVCSEWDDFMTFYNDMGPKPGPDYSIDRIDNDKGYCKDNCRWANWTTQARNQGRVKTYTYKGFTGCIPELAAHFNVKANTIHKGIQAGKTIEATMDKILAPIELITYKGYSLTKSQWIKKLGVPAVTFYWRLRKHKENLDKVFESYDIV